MGVSAEWKQPINNCKFFDVDHEYFLNSTDQSLILQWNTAALFIN